MRLPRIASPALVLLASCGLLACGLPGELRDKAEGLGERIDRETREVEAREAKLGAFLSEEENRFLAPYAERESWAAHFEAALGEISRARELHAQAVAPLLEANRSEDEGALRTELSRLVQTLERAAHEAREPANRAAFLKETREEAPERVAANALALTAAETALRGAVLEVDRASGDYAEKAEDLAGRLAAVRNENRAALALQADAQEELAKLGSDDVDLAKLGDAARGAALGAAAVSTGATALGARVGELYRSYSKTLIDMKEEAKAEIGRTSWNEAVDFPRESELRYAVPVSPEQLATLEAWGDRPIATLSSFFGRSSLNVAIDQAIWDALRIDPKAQLPRGDDSAEFWVGDSSARYFHRYRVVEGEQSQESDWVEVEEALYEQHYDDLGMDIVSKPYGSYEDEVLTVAAPPGLAYVGNPKYGKWENDESGRQRWSWGQNFLFYYLIFGGRRHYYYHDDWRGWRGGYRGRSAWYGPNDSYGTYGSRTRNSSKYAGGAFASGGGFRRADASVRGAGPAGRGGGPGGRGK